MEECQGEEEPTPEEVENCLSFFLGLSSSKLMDLIVGETLPGFKSRIAAKIIIQREIG